MSLPQLQNRLRVQTEWLWSYFTGQRSSRLTAQQHDEAEHSPRPDACFRVRREVGRVDRANTALQRRSLLLRQWPDCDAAGKRNRRCESRFAKAGAECERPRGLRLTKTHWTLSSVRGLQYAHLKGMPHRTVMRILPSGFQIRSPQEVVRRLVPGDGQISVIAIRRQGNLPENSIGLRPKTEHVPLLALSALCVLLAHRDGNFLPKRPHYVVVATTPVTSLMRFYGSAVDADHDGDIALTANATAIVCPEIIIRWHRMGFRAWWRWKSHNPGGRPRIDQQPRDLVRRMCKESLWGAPRIHGELLKLGCDVAQSMVSKYMLRRRVSADEVVSIRPHAKPA
jgi:hypothetical protein